MSRFDMTHRDKALRAGDPERLQHLETMADVVQFPTVPLLQTHLFPPELDSLPVLIVDLNDNDEQRASETLAEFEQLGIPRRRTLVDGTPLALGPPGWGYYLWPWQIHILAGAPPPLRQPRKLLFTELLSPSDWYDQLAHGETGGMGLFIGNFFEQDVSAQAVLDRMSAGKLLACVIPGNTSDRELR
ncbi:hypothetical protein [Mycobacteroides abscessus]|uniref:hypothetical protein n=1 Tax=Mycobacteroides abscessus TaxID=36809 RepID=UPI0009408988|nr:hypothetical protein [Mycobacteroides abscessus]